MKTRYPTTTWIITLTACGALATGCTVGGDGDGTTAPATAEQLAAINGLIETFETLSDADPIAGANAVWGYAFTMMFTAIDDGSGGPQFPRRAADDSCVVESGDLVTFDCPQVTGWARRLPDGAEVDMTIDGVYTPQPSRMRIAGTARWPGGRSFGDMVIEVTTDTSAVSIDVTWDVAVSGGCATGWMEMTFDGSGDPGPGGPPQWRTVRIDLTACNDATVTYR